VSQFACCCWNCILLTTAAGTACFPCGVCTFDYIINELESEILEGHETWSNVEFRMEPNIFRAIAALLRICSTFFLGNKFTP
jgi:hypothetical protein